MPLWLHPFLLLFVPLASCSHSEDTSDERQEVPVAAILPGTNTEYAWAWPRVGPAVVRAVQAVNSDPSLLPRLKLQLLFGDSENKDGICSNSYAPLAAVDFNMSHKPWAFLGPGCEYSSSTVALFTSHWGVPMVTAGARAYAFEEMEAVINTGPTHMKLGHVVYQVQKRFGWHQNVVLLYSDDRDLSNDSPYFFPIEGVFKVLSNKSISTYYRNLEDNDDLAALAQEVMDNGRVVYVCCPWEKFRTMMVAFLKEGMELRDFVFFFINLFADNMDGPTPIRPWLQGDADDTTARSAFMSVKVLTYHHPRTLQYLQFVENLKRDAKEMFNFTITDSVSNIIAGGFYDGIVIFSHALNETLNLQEPGPVLRPRRHAVTQRMKNRTFPGVMGPVLMDEFGDREMDYALWDMTDVDSGEFQVVCVYDSSVKQLVLQNGLDFQWPRGSPPPDKPECGFKNDDPSCITSTLTMNQMVTVVMCIFFVLIATVAVFMYRKLKLESELSAQLWRVSWDDVQISDMGKVMMRSCSRLTMSLKGSICGSLMTMGGKIQIYTKTGYYKGNLAAIKHINKKRIELTRDVLFELKHMRDVQNDHLTRFIGACIDAPNMCIITEYCPRGSLQDLMESDGITLDWMFRFSLINDIVKGMSFLHNSVIVSHGNLKSSNCVVDSRFVLKITDYGLWSLRSSQMCSEELHTHAYYSRKLWTSPELLRTSCPPSCGTQKGDVYSFGVILQEVALLKGVFYLEGHSLSPKEIVLAVTRGGSTPLRPSLCLQSHSEALGALMQRCWNEEPSDRPDFSNIKAHLRRNHRDYGSNILDNLLSRMEQYANNLEGLVEERTQAYHEEKRKAETLLYQILPHSVAEQLKRGQTVQAEAFDSVSIYFSDIVGFTVLSAESTPLQVVSLLNDLYTCFDDVIDNFDVYKVETIGDAYMVASGLPVRNGNIHAREVARMALALLESIKTFRIRDRDDQQLRLRIGIHSGPVCAGVVGLKMPRYCLFGDTVNTASRMESTGEALRIHVSEATHEVLQEFRRFQLQPRGDIQVKGKGHMRTYWLLGEDPEDKDP